VAVSTAPNLLHRYENGNVFGNVTGNIGGSVYGNTAPVPTFVPSFVPTNVPTSVPCSRCWIPLRKSRPSLTDQVMLDACLL
jgi:hypothetical protein